MSKHEETYVDLDQPYEKNIIGFKGIIYFVVGLFLLIVVTFGLMWVFQHQVLQPRAEEADRLNADPLALTAEERLPPEPRLQAAPGFGIEDPNGGRINLELREPQAEYRALKKQWEKQWKDGQKDVVTGTVISLPIKEAKEKLLADKSLKAKSGKEGERAYEDATMKVSPASSGRVASIKSR